jgi:hypothetical protein
MGSKPQTPDTGSFKGDLEMLIKHVAQQLRTAKWATVAPSIMDAAERDEDLAKVQARIHSEMMSPFRAVVERAQHRGELPRALDPSHVVAAILGPLFYRRWLSREPLDEAFAKAVVENATRKSN